MGCVKNDDGTIIMCGNFAEVLPEKPEKPENFDYINDAKWLEEYPEKWERITIGKTTCDCKKIETHYAPYYGYTWFHSEDCG